jgi:hypothetical protein
LRQIWLRFVFSPARSSGTFWNTAERYSMLAEHPSLSLGLSLPSPRLDRLRAPRGSHHTLPPPTQNFRGKIRRSRSQLAAVYVYLFFLAVARHLGPYSHHQERATSRGDPEFHFASAGREAP